jgi:hypothetical protein
MDPWHGKTCPSSCFGPWLCVHISQETAGPYIFGPRDPRTVSQSIPADDVLCGSSHETQFSGLPREVRERIFLALVKAHFGRHIKHYAFGLRPEWRSWLSVRAGASLRLSIEEVTNEKAIFNLYETTDSCRGFLSLLASFTWTATTGIVALRKRFDRARRGYINGSLSGALSLAGATSEDGHSELLSADGSHGFRSLFACRNLLGSWGSLDATKRDTSRLSLIPEAWEDLWCARSPNHAFFRGDSEFQYADGRIFCSQRSDIPDPLTGARPRREIFRWGPGFAEIQATIAELQRNGQLAA